MSQHYDGTEAASIQMHYESIESIFLASSSLMTEFFLDFARWDRKSFCIGSHAQTYIEDIFTEK